MAGSNEELRARLAEVLALRREAENEPLESLGRTQAQGSFKDSAVMFFHDFGDETLAALAPAQEPAGGGESRKPSDAAIADAFWAARARINATPSCLVDPAEVRWGDEIVRAARLATPTPQAAGVSQSHCEACPAPGACDGKCPGGAPASQQGVSAEAVLDEYVRICVNEHHDDASREARIDAMRRALTAAGAAPEGWPFGEEHGAEVMTCQIGDYKAVEPREMAAVIFDDKKVAECYTNEDAELVGRALRMLAASPQPGAQENV